MQVNHVLHIMYHHMQTVINVRSTTMYMPVQTFPQTQPDSTHPHDDDLHIHIRPRNLDPSSWNPPKGLQLRHFQLMTMMIPYPESVPLTVDRARTETGIRTGPVARLAVGIR